MMKEEASKEQEEEDPKKTTSVKENVIWRPHKPNQGAGGGSAKTCSKYVTQRGELEKPFGHTHATDESGNQGL